MSYWHCTTDHTTWPGCGRCGGCRQLAPEMFDRLRQIRDWATAQHGGAKTPAEVWPGLAELLNLTPEPTP